MTEISSQLNSIRVYCPTRSGIFPEVPGWCPIYTFLFSFTLVCPLSSVFRQQCSVKRVSQFSANGVNYQTRPHRFIPDKSYSNRFITSRLLGRNSHPAPDTPLLGFMSGTSSPQSTSPRKLPMEANSHIMSCLSAGGTSFTLTP